MGSCPFVLTLFVWWCFCEQKELRRQATLSFTNSKNKGSDKKSANANTSPNATPHAAPAGTPQLNAAGSGGLAPLTLAPAVISPTSAGSQGSQGQENEAKATPMLRPVPAPGSTPALTATPAPGAGGRHRAGSTAKQPHHKPDAELEMTGGSALDRALVQYAHTRLNIQLTRTIYDKCIELPFTSTTKTMISVHEVPANATAQAAGFPGPGCLVIVKGAPEYVIKLCNTCLEEDGGVARVMCCGMLLLCLGLCLCLVVWFCVL
jgi:hypothetical protein